MIHHDFTERLYYSLRVSTEQDWERFYRSVWPNFASMETIDDLDLQRQGIDRRVRLANGRSFTIDEKLRETVSERTEHPTQKPETLVCELVARHTRENDLILDPYVGSGTTLAAARRLGRRSIGIERDERWCEIAAMRLGQLSLFEATVPPTSGPRDGNFEWE